MRSARAFKRLGQVGLCGLLLYHLLATTVYNLPKTTSLGDGLHRWTEPYVKFFGLWQEWDMFSTIPWFHRLDATLLVVDETGATTEHPPVLPGLRPPGDNLRFAAAWVRLAGPSGASHQQGRRYFQNACEAASSKLGRRVHSVRLQVDAQRLRSLSQIRRDGKIAQSQTHTSRSYTCQW